MLYNASSEIGMLITATVQNTTGSLWMALLMLIMVIMIFAAMLRIPMEFTAILLVPLMIVIMANVAEYIQVGGILLLYIAVLFAKNTGFWR